MMSRSLTIFYLDILVAALAHCSSTPENFAVDYNMSNSWLYDNMSYSSEVQMDNRTLPARSLDISFSPTFAPVRTKSRSPSVIYIQGLFELSETSFATSGHSEQAAAELAIRHVNEQQVIMGYELEMYINDTKAQVIFNWFWKETTILPSEFGCDTGVAVDAFFHALYRKPQMIMLLGTSCSDVTQQLALIVKYWNLLQVSHGSISPALSERKEFPLFFRTVAPDSSHNAARRAFIQHFGWDTVATLTQNQDMYSLAINDLIKVLEEHNITLAAAEIFAETHFLPKLESLQQKDCRIIIGSFSVDVARKIFCEAYRLGLYGSHFVWMLQGGYTERWWEHVVKGCTKEEMAKAVEGYISVESHNAMLGNKTSISGLTNEKFLKEYSKMGLSYMSTYAPQTYDAVWTIALTLREASKEWLMSGSKTKLGDFNYKRDDMTKTFFKIMGSLEFQGVSGPISFIGPDRRGVSSFHQNQGGVMRRVALFYPDSQHLDFRCPGCFPIVWRNGKPPAAHRKIQRRIKTVNSVAFISIVSLSGLGIVMAFGYLAFNLNHRKLKYIKLSSPKLNNLAVIGCVLVYTAVILLGLDHATLPMDDIFPIICMIRAFLLSAGYSLAFGGMFTKMYRVHQIFTRASSGVVKSKLLQDKQLLAVVSVLLVIDCFIIFLWILIDPMYRNLKSFALEPSPHDRDLFYIPQIEQCQSIHINKWMGALYAYKGLLLVFGAYMAWETRRVKVPALNDSQYIGMSIYNVVIISIIVVAMANIISDEETLSYVLVSTLILISTTTTLCLLFLPKIHTIWKHPNGDPILAGTGLKIEYNTRRFAFDDRKELYYRAEVQNRVYRRDLMELDQEISRLERLLELPMDPYTRLTEEILYLLPENKRGETPLAIRRRRLQKSDLNRLESITDTDDVTSELPNIRISAEFLDQQKLSPVDFSKLRLMPICHQTLEGTQLELVNLDRGKFRKSQDNLLHSNKEDKEALKYLRRHTTVCDPRLFEAIDSELVRNVNISGSEFVLPSKRDASRLSAESVVEKKSKSKERFKEIAKKAKESKSKKPFSGARPKEVFTLSDRKLERPQTLVPQILVHSPEASSPTSATPTPGTSGVYSSRKQKRINKIQAELHKLQKELRNLEDDQISFV